MKGSEISVYVHIPFCVRKCLYCDFNSAVQPDYIIDSYINALLTELDLKREAFVSRQLVSVYIGGGTPSSIPPSYIRLILERISSYIPINDDTEITIEINPGTTVDHKIGDYVACGINRISIGLQSADDEELKALGRIHDFETFLHTYDVVSNAGIDNINVDIMTSIPHQNKESLVSTLKKVTGLKPQHISAYSLIIEPGTPFYQRGAVNLDLPSEDESLEMDRKTREFLDAAGYKRYEISNYAKKDEKRDFRCLHNLRYWDRGDYLGFGVSAASLYGNRRFTNIADIGPYITSPGRQVSEDLLLSPDDAAAEFMFLGLRKTDGIRLLDFKEEFGTDIKRIYGHIMKKQVEKELAMFSGEGDEERFMLTDRGLEVSNIVMSEFLR
ncbi:MAG: radical SAM family heme chaperone HemW [Lachnospiraceae bacterium]|nr:radical SAM family heme chaperone HemW [Lachnospiraceae bacterium]